MESSLSGIKWGFSVPGALLWEEEYFSFPPLLMTISAPGQSQNVSEMSVTQNPGKPEKAAGLHEKLLNNQGLKKTLLKVQYSSFIYLPKATSTISTPRVPLGSQPEPL